MILIINLNVVIYLCFSMYIRCLELTSYIVESGSVNDRVLLFYHELKVMYNKLCGRPLHTLTHVHTHVIVCVHVYLIHCQVMALNNLAMIAVGQGDDGKAFQLLAKALSSQLSEYCNIHTYIVQECNNVVMTHPLYTTVVV